jgi:hypothetical protein
MFRPLKLHLSNKIILQQGCSYQYLLPSTHDLYVQPLLACRTEIQ